jgi:hypothetical protein
LLIFPWPEALPQKQQQQEEEQWSREEEEEEEENLVLDLWSLGVVAMECVGFPRLSFPRLGGREDGALVSQRSRGLMMKTKKLKAPHVPSYIFSRHTHMYACMHACMCARVHAV